MNDLDVNNATSLVFNIVGGPDMEYFYLKADTGILYPNMNFRASAQTVYNIEVNVTDDWGAGFSDHAAVKVLSLH